MKDNQHIAHTNNALALLSEKVERLESQNRWLKLVSVLPAILIACLFVMGNTFLQSKEIDANKFILTDETKKIRAEIKLNEQSESVFVFYDTQGNKKAELKVDNNGVYRTNSVFIAQTMNTNKLELKDSNQRITVLEAGSLKVSNAINYTLIDSSKLEFQDRNKKTIIGAGGLEMFSPHSIRRVYLNASDNSNITSFALFNGNNYLGLVNKNNESFTEFGIMNSQQRIPFVRFGQVEQTGYLNLSSQFNRVFITSRAFPQEKQLRLNSPGILLLQNNLREPLWKVPL